jgi:hypothetical protein
MGKFVKGHPSGDAAVTFSHKPEFVNEESLRGVDTVPFDWFGVGKFLKLPLKKFVFRHSDGQEQSILATRDFKDEELSNIFSFSFGPFLGIYLSVRYFWDFIVAELALYLFWWVIITVIVVKKALTLDFMNMPSPLFWCNFAFALALFGLRIFAGTRARKLAWNRLNWATFEDFKASESVWNAFGIIAFVLFVIGLLISFIFAVV